MTSNAITMPGLSGARTIAYGYDAAGNRTRVTWPDAFFVDYAYDALSRMTSASENGTVTLATYAYDRLSRRVGLTYGNGATVAYGRSWAGDLLSLVHAWGSDPNNLGGGSGVTFTHTYAPDHRLASTVVSSTAFEWKPGSGGAMALGTDIFNPANLLNQLTQVTLAGASPQTVTWDAAGNMVSDGAFTYTHDAENRLTNVTRTTPSLTATYTYDPLGRRVQRNVNSTSTFTLHDGDEEIAEYDATGALIRRFIPGPGTDEPIAIVVPASGGGAPERRFFHEDRIGNVIAMSGLASGGAAPALAEGPFTYDAYGRSPQPPGTSATSTPFRYTGRRLDAETGNYYYRARFYTPTLGQFIETDPVGYADSLNMYAYVGGDPVNGVDPSGACRVNEKGELEECKIVFRSGVSEAQKSEYLAAITAWGTAIQDRGSDDIKGAWDGLAKIVIGDNAAGDGAVGKASFGISPRNLKAGKSGIDGTIWMSHDQLEAGTSRIDTQEVAKTFFHELGHGTNNSLRAAFAGSTNMEESEADFAGISEAISLGVLPADSTVRVYHSNGRGFNDVSPAEAATKIEERFRELGIERK